jgi:hypothetical protein
MDRNTEIIRKVSTLKSMVFLQDLQDVDVAVYLSISSIPSILLILSNIFLYYP